MWSTETRVTKQETWNTRRAQRQKPKDLELGTKTMKINKSQSQTEYWDPCDFSKTANLQ